MKNTILITVLFLPLLSFADIIGYNKTVELRAESNSYIVIHYHDWSSATLNSRYEMISTHQNPFNSSNDYAYILCINKTTKDTIFKSPSPALTQIKISKDEKYIVGISKIMVWNPYQFVLFNTSGSLIKKQHISSKEAKLTETEFEEFKFNFPEQYSFLNSLDRVFKKDRNYFIDFSSMGMPKKLGEAWSYLFKFYYSNHLSKNFSESVTNWVFWYYDESPNLTFEYENDRLISISLLDPKKEKIRIRI